MLAIEPPRRGRIIEWAIEDILRHESCDMEDVSDGGYRWACALCEQIYEQDLAALWLEMHAGIECAWNYRRTDAETWDVMLSDKREADPQYYAEVLSSIRMDGFVGPLNAYMGGDTEVTTFGQLVFGDGHHRLAAAIELGYRTVPVRITGKLHVSFDSGGDWAPGEEIPCLVPDFNHRPNRV